MKLASILKSRTVWTFVALFIFNGLQGTQIMVPVEYLGIVNGLLSLLGIYFRANPVQK